MRATLQGINGSDALFRHGDTGVIVNTRTFSARTLPFEEAEFLQVWYAPARNAPVSTWAEVAECSTRQDEGDVTVVSSGHESRAYTIPKAVRQEASRGLSLRSRHSRGGTAVSLRVAELLASGGQVSVQDIRHLARYFSHHESSRDTFGWRPGEGNYPSESRVGWSMWGGDPGWKWAQGVVDKLPLVANADPEINLIEFYDAEANERTFYAEKASPDTDEVNALFTQDAQGGWRVWFDGDWKECSRADVNLENLVELDDDAAVYVGSSLYDAPEAPVSLRAYDPEEWDLVQAGMPGVDWEVVDRSLSARNLTAAGADDYTPAERSKNAAQQPRDAAGRFARVGDTGVTKGGIRGRITTVNPVDRTLIVTDDQGNSYAIPAGDFTIDKQPTQPGQPTQPTQPVPAVPPLNLDKILGQPRVTDTTPKAWLKKLLPPLNAAALKKVITDYEGFITKERQSRAGDFKGGTPWRENRPMEREQRELEREVRSWDDEDDRRRKRESQTASGELSDPAKPTPDNTDVAPMYLAIVDRDDPQAVTDLVALVPASATSDEATAFRRVAGSWVEDVKILQDMRSPTPPPVVKLDETTYADVLSQVDAAGTEGAEDEEALEGQQSVPTPPGDGQATPPVAASGLDLDMEPACIPMWDADGRLIALVAQGGLDRNRGNAERLRRYWLHGPGAAKIMWGTPGDWTRCYRLLSKHMGVRAKGYCALRHKEATGMWTGDREHEETYGAAGEKTFSSRDDLKTLRRTLRASAEAARADVARRRVRGEAGVIPVNPTEISGERQGSAFRIPLLVPEGVESGDGRTFNAGALTTRHMPIPLLWQIQTGEGHNGSVLVGRIDRVERVPNGLGNAFGVFDTGPYGQEAERLVREKMLQWVSVDLDNFEAAEELANGDDEDDESVKQRKLKIKKARAMAATLVPKPAFQECTIELVPDGEVIAVEDGAYVGEPEAITAAALVSAGSTALKIPVSPPTSWFENPRLSKASPITVTDDGQVFGHIAAWNVDHIGMPFGTRAPRSSSGYAYFHTGVVKTDEGKDVHVGQLTLAGGHAPLNADAAAAVKHYDDTASAVADVHAGEDKYGIWVAGALRPGVSPEQIRGLRASAPSGDWREINGRLELVAVCQVNVPGFPVTRAQVASGHVSALVAAGASTLAKLRNDPVDELSSRIARLEAHDRKQDEARVAAAREKMKPLLDKRAEEREKLDSLAASARERVYLALDVDGYLTEFKDFSGEKRDKLAKEGKALKDGSFPIENVADLRRAVRAYGRTNEEKRGKVRRHIVKRARALGKTELIPKDWKEASLNELALQAADARETLTAAAEARTQRELRTRAEAAISSISEFKSKGGERRKGTMPGDRYPIRDKEELRKAIHAFGRGKPSDKPDIKRHIISRAKAIGASDMIPDDWK